MIGTALAILFGSLAAAGGEVYASNKQSSAAKQAAQLSTDSANTAADIQARSDQQALDYAKQVEAQRQKEYARTEGLNLEQHNIREGLLTPYRNLGEQSVRTLGTLMQPGSGAAYLPPQARTLNQLVGG